MGKRYIKLSTKLVNETTLKEASIWPIYFFLLDYQKYKKRLFKGTLKDIAKAKNKSLYIISKGAKILENKGYLTIKRQGRNKGSIFKAYYYPIKAQN